MRGLLGRGGSTNPQVDQVGKAGGEFLLAWQLDIPVELLVDAYCADPVTALRLQQQNSRRSRVTVSVE